MADKYTRTQPWYVLPKPYQGLNFCVEWCFYLLPLIACKRGKFFSHNINGLRRQFKSTYASETALLVAAAGNRTTGKSQQLTGAFCVLEPTYSKRITNTSHGSSFGSGSKNGMSNVWLETLNSFQSAWSKWLNCPFWRRLQDIKQRIFGNLKQYLWEFVLPNISSLLLFRWSASNW